MALNHSKDLLVEKISWQEATKRIKSGREVYWICIQKHKDCGISHKIGTNSSLGLRIKNDLPFPAGSAPEILSVEALVVDKPVWLFGKPPHWQMWLEMEVIHSSLACFWESYGFEAALIKKQGLLEAIDEYRQRVSDTLAPEEDEFSWAIDLDKGLRFFAKGWFKGMEKLHTQQYGVNFPVLENKGNRISLVDTALIQRKSDDNYIWWDTKKNWWTFLRKAIQYKEEPALLFLKSRSER